MAVDLIWISLESNTMMLQLQEINLHPKTERIPLELESCSCSTIAIQKCMCSSSYHICQRSARKMRDRGTEFVQE